MQDGFPLVADVTIVCLPFHANLGAAMKELRDAHAHVSSGITRYRNRSLHRRLRHGEGG